EGVRPAGVAGDLDALHGRQAVINLPAQGRQLGFQRGDLALHVQVLVPRHVLELSELALQLHQRLLELEIVRGGHDPIYLALTRRTRSGPRSSRRPRSKSSSSSTRRRRERNLAWVPFPSLHSTNNGAGPGCAVHSAVAARAESRSGPSPYDHFSESPTAPVCRSPA